MAAYVLTLGTHTDVVRLRRMESRVRKIKDPLKFLEAFLFMKTAALYCLFKYDGVVGPLVRFCSQDEKLKYQDQIPILRERLKNPTLTLVQRVATVHLLESYTIWTPRLVKTLPGISRNDPATAKWREDVLCRDKRQCVMCASTDRVQAHHIEPWASNPDKRVILENGITLCFNCHMLTHHPLFAEAL